MRLKKRTAINMQTVVFMAVLMSDQGLFAMSGYDPWRRLLFEGVIAAK